MKKSLLSILIALLATFTAQTVNAQEYKNLPKNAKTYIQKHFKGYNITHYENERDFFDVEHKVYVSNNNCSYKLEFDKAGNIDNIESLDDRTPLPKSVISVKMSQHVKGKFPHAQIIEWKKKKNTQVIELSNDVELVFNNNGDFLRIDD